VTRRLLARLLQSLAVLLLVAFAGYTLIGLMPGDPLHVMLSTDPRLTSEDVARLERLYGLDRPLPERFLGWLAAALSGDLGHSRLFARPVVEVLGPRLFNTLLLMGPSLLLALALAFPVGIAAALRPGSRRDIAANVLALAFLSLPSFWLALLFIVMFSVVLGWLPPGGTGGGEVVERLRHMVLPVLTLTLGTFGVFVRFVRAAVLEVLREPFVAAARAKGLSTARLVLHHVLPAALPPLINVIALHFGALLSGAVVVETVFAWPGMGRLLYDAVLGNDFNLALAALLLGTALTLLANLLADLLHVRLDPRLGEGL